MKKNHYKQEVEEWLRKAEGDLLSAKAIIKANAPAWATCFHCQQAVEKSFKALLLFTTNSYPKEHDLLKLEKLLVINKVKSIKLWHNALLILTNYYVADRYPGMKQHEITPAQAKQALNYAQKIFEFVKKIIDGS